MAKSIKLHQENTPQKTAQSSTTNNVFNFDKAIFINKGGYFNNGGFFTGFSKSFLEMATNEQLNKLDLKLLMLLLSYMGEKEMMIGPNRQRLLTTQQYATALKMGSKGRISTSFQNLEREGYIFRNKTSKEVEIHMNPNVAYNGKTKDFPQVWNQLSVPFGLSPRKVEDENGIEEQDWDSHLLEDIRKANDSLDE